MKKLLMAAALFMSTFAAKADNAITASLKVTSEKDAATVHVNLDNTSTFVAFQFDIAFPEGMTLNNQTAQVQITDRLKNNGVVDLSTVGGKSDESTNFTIATNWVSNNVLRVIGYNLGNESITSNSGEILSIKVIASEATASVSDWTAKFSTSDFVTKEDLAEINIDLANANDNTVQGQEESTWRMGDVNHDGKVNVLDVSLAKDKSLGKTPENFYQSEADVNKDDKVNVLDVSWIIDEALNIEHK